SASGSHAGGLAAGALLSLAACCWSCRAPGRPRSSPPVFPALTSRTHGTRVRWREPCRPATLVDGHTERATPSKPGEGYVMSPKASTNVDRLGLHRLATVACFGALAAGFPACG